MAEPRLSEVKGLRWYPNGQAALSGDLGLAYQALDRLFRRVAAEEAAEELWFPVLLPAAELHRLDYFRSFPHLCTFACTLEADEANLRAFRDGPVLDEAGGVALTRTAPVGDVLTPAACYHVYVHLRDQALARPLVVTTRAACFRREVEYRPLRRQWSFGMREIVCLGGAGEVQAFLERARHRVGKVLAALDLPVLWQGATDPFFDPRSNPRWLAQKLDPVKTEMVFGGDLAIGSINFHRNFFGETFGISIGGQAAFSGCVAFGLERWLWALLARHGTDPSRWPELDEVWP
jgi:hypothetical protein